MNNIAYILPYKIDESNLEHNCNSINLLLADVPDDIPFDVHFDVLFMIFYLMMLLAL